VPGRPECASTSTLSRLRRTGCVPAAFCDRSHRYLTCARQIPQLDGATGTPFYLNLATGAVSLSHPNLLWSRGELERQRQVCADLLSLFPARPPSSPPIYFIRCSALKPRQVRAWLAFVPFRSDSGKRRSGSAPAGWPERGRPSKPLSLRHPRLPPSLPPPATCRGSATIRRQQHSSRCALACKLSLCFPLNQKCYLGGLTAIVLAQPQNRAPRFLPVAGSKQDR